MSEEDQKAIRKRIRDPLAETKRKLRLKEKAVERKRKIANLQPSSSSSSAAVEADQKKRKRGRTKIVSKAKTKRVKEEERKTEATSKINEEVEVTLKSTESEEKYYSIQQKWSILSYGMKYRTFDDEKLSDDALDAIKTRFGCTFAIIKRIFKKYDTQIRSGTIWPDLSTTKCIVKAEKKAKITSLAERCQHSRVKKRCWECRPELQCQIQGHANFGRNKDRCIDCGSREFCEHKKRRYRCKECGGSSRCEHGIIRYDCRQCGGKGICKHNRQRYHCKFCKEIKKIEETAKLSGTVKLKTQDTSTSSSASLSSSSSSSLDLFRLRTDGSLILSPETNRTVAAPTPTALSSLSDIQFLQQQQIDSLNRHFGSSYSTGEELVFEHVEL